MNMINICRGVMLVALTLIGIGLFNIDYSDLSWSNNAGYYITIGSMVCTFTSTFLSVRHYKKQATA